MEIFVAGAIPPSTPLVYHTFPDSSSLTYRTNTVITETLYVRHRADLFVSSFGTGLANNLATNIFYHRKDSEVP